MKMGISIQKIIITSIILITLMQAVPASLAEDSGPTTWHQFQKDAENSGLYQSSLPEAYDLFWSNSTVHAVADSSPVVAEGKVFVNTYYEADCYLKALDLNTGVVLWSTPIPRIEYSSWSSPSYHDGMVFTSTGSYTTCVNATDGSQIWAFRSPVGEPSCNGGPTIADGKVFCSDWYGGHYFCLEEYTTNPEGSELWNFTAIYAGGSGDFAGSRTPGTPAYKDDRVYLTSNDYNAPQYEGYVYCLNATNGSEIWTTGLEHNACGSAAVSDDAVYVTTYNFYGDATACALNKENGSIIWETTISRTDSTPTIAYGNVYISAGYTSTGHQVYCINASNGTILWETDTEDKIGSWTNSVAVADGKVFAGIVSGGSSMVGGYCHLVELDAFTGDILWKTTGGSTSAISDGTIYTIGEDGTVYSYVAAIPDIDVTTDNVVLPTGIAFPYFENEITATVSNEGNLYVENVYVFLMENGTEVDNQVIPLLGGQCSQEISFDWEAPGPGDYQITIESSYDGSVSDTDSSNDAMSIAVTAIDGNPDLVATEITPSAIYVNQSYTMGAIIENLGYSVADPFEVKVMEGSTVLANETISSLNPAQSTEVEFTWMVSNVGNADLTVVVDTSNNVTEEDETNNELVQSIEVKSSSSFDELSDTDWPQFQCDSYNNGVTDSYAPTDSFIDLNWSADDFDGYVDVPPVVVGDLVYVLPSSGLVYAYNKYNGTTEWQRDIGESTSSLNSATPAYGDGNLFIATYGGNLSALNSSSGLIQWSIHVTDDSIESPVTYYDHRVYVADGIAQGVGTKYYRCYDDMGTWLWSYEVPDSAGFIWNGAAIVDQYIVFSTHEGKLISLDRKAGTLVDEINLNGTESSEVSFAKADPGIFRSSVMYNDGFVYTTSERGQTTGYVWKVGFNADGTFTDQDGWCSDQIFSTSTPAIYDGKIYVGQGEHGYPGELICLDDSTGNELWSYDVPNGVKSSPVVSTYYDEAYIYFTSAMEDGSVYCLNESGSLLWEYNPPDSEYILQGVAVSEGKAYFGTDGGYIYCIDGDWNPWNDPDSEEGDIISYDEVLDAIIYWKYYMLAPGTNHQISREEILDTVFYWKYKLPMVEES
jgi:outer membrane protein assembly factor BamB